MEEKQLQSSPIQKQKNWAKTSHGLENVEIYKGLSSKKRQFINNNNDQQFIYNNMDL